MTLTLDDARQSKADAGHRGDTVTLLQDAAGSGHPVMFPGTRESRTVPMAATPQPPAGGYRHVGASPMPDDTGSGGRAIQWLVGRLIAAMR